MNKSDRHEDDILKHLIDAGRIEKAPDGFTEAVMTRIRFETETTKLSDHVNRRITVPVIAAMTVILLVVVSLIAPSGNTEPSVVLKFVQGIKVPAFKISLESLPAINLPGWIAWFFVGLLLLVIFDLALSSLFHRQRH